MDKFRRMCKTSPQHNLPATSSSSSGMPSTSKSSTKFTIEQKVAGAVKKGPYSVKRSVDPNEVIINRRPGEGSKPLFPAINTGIKRSVSPKKKPIGRASSSDSSSQEDHHRHRRNPPKPQPTTRRKSPEKIPYFIDEKREKERISRKYESRRSRSLSRDRRKSKIHARTRSRTPPSYRRRRSYERRSPSRDRYRSRYRRTRSRSRERRRRIDSLDDRHQMSLQPQLAPVTKYIPIPVPVEYPFMQQGWPGPMMPPQPRFPFPMGPAVPMPMPYLPRVRPFRPPRYVPNGNFQRGNFRPRQY